MPEVLSPSPLAGMSVLMRTPGRDTSVSWEEPEPEPEVKLSWDGAYSLFNSLCHKEKSDLKGADEA